MDQQRSVVETLVGACDELSLLLRTLEITRTQNFISVKSVSTPSEAQAAQRVAAHKRAGLLAAGRSLRRSLELNKELLAAEDEKRRDRAQEEREKEDTMPQLSQQAHLHLLYQALKQDERIAELEAENKDLENRVLELRNGVEVVEKRASEHKAMADKKRKDEIDFLKYQGQHLDQFLRQLGPVAK